MKLKNRILPVVVVDISSRKQVTLRNSVISASFLRVSSKAKLAFTTVSYCTMSVMEERSMQIPKLHLIAHSIC